MSTTRQAILDRIRSALSDVTPAEKTDAPPIPRDYRQNSEMSQDALIEQLHERLDDYKAIVHIVTPDELTMAIARSLEARTARRILIPADLPFELPVMELEWLREPGQSLADIESSDGVLTTCAVAIAETGTIVLDCGPGQGRRSLSLVPDYHLCIVYSNQIVGLVPEAIARLSGPGSNPTSPMTWISGPSATSDIELNRVEGVHGPRTLEVLIVKTDG